MKDRSTFIATFLDLFSLVVILVLFFQNTQDKQAWVLFLLALFTIAVSRYNQGFADGKENQKQNNFL